MSAESGPSMETIASFNKDTLSSSVSLSEKFQKAGVLGKKDDESQIDIANQNVSEILKSSFTVGNVAETQINPILAYESVGKMVEIVNDRNITESVKQRAEKALIQIGLALSFNNTVFDATTDGNLEEVTPSNLHGIEPYVLSSYLTSGKDDKEGQELVRELVNVFRLKKRADKDPEYYEDDYKKSSKGLFTKLLDKCDEASNEDEHNGNKGRWENMIGYIRAINSDDKPKPTEKDEIKDEVLTDLKVSTAILMQEIVSNGLKEDDNPELYSKLLNETANGKLSEALRYIMLARKVKNESRYKREEKLPEGGIDEIYEYIDYIEQGSSRVDDLSRNSERFRVLYQIQNGIFNEQLEGMEYNGKRLDKKDVELLRTDIEMRMFLHELAIPASKCSSIEDIVRTVSTTHEGDVDHSVDRKLITFFLEKACGLKNLPVFKAWDLRQDGYYNILGLREEIFKSYTGFKKFWEERYKGDESKLSSFDKTFADVTLRSSHESEKMDREKIQKAITIKKNERYGIDSPVYKNLFIMEKTDSNDVNMIKDYMVWQLMDGGTYSYGDALKSFELAKKLSVATFFDSRANIVFASDDYSELILTKYLRYSDGPDTNGVKMGKSKSVGSAITIPLLDSLTCHWMDLSAKKEKGWRNVYSPLKHDEIDFSKIDGKGDMAYHFSAVVASQVIPFKDALYDKINPKDVLSFSGMNKLFAKINKTTNDMIRARIMPLNENHIENGLYDMPSKGDKSEDILSSRINTKMRKVYILNLLDLIGIDTSGWTSSDYKSLENMLLFNPQLYDEKGRPGGSFIPPKDVRDCIKRTNVIWRTANNDAETKLRKKRYTY